MRNVSPKPTTLRTARARAELTAAKATLDAVREGRVPKGDPLPVAKVAAVQAAKKTTDWIPYCHNIPIEAVDVATELLEDRIRVEVAVTTVAKTGVEMEAMTAAAAAVLTLYDMLKMLDEDMEIVGVRLLEKRGGKSDFEPQSGWNAAVLVASDRVAAGEAVDRSGEILVAGLRAHGAASVTKEVVPDEVEAIRSAVEASIGAGVEFVLVTGGTGVGPRDRTPEALAPLIQTPLPGVVEALRSQSQARVPTAMLSRPVAGLAGRSVVVALPGSPGACQDALAALFPAILHVRSMLAGGGHP